jgi:hypothetical protein
MMASLMVMAMTSCPEIWKDVPGYEGKYQASSLGRIRSLDRRVSIGKGATRLMRGRVLRAAGSKKMPHLMVVLGHGAHGSPVHQLVALTFLGPRPKGCDVRHLDGDPLNNKVSNLAYGSRTDNILDVYRIGRAWRKLTAEQALEIRRRLQNGERGVDLAREYGVGQACISSIKVGRIYAWLQNGA